jgi:hypothetical protein
MERIELKGWVKSLSGIITHNTINDFKDLPFNGTFELRVMKSVFREHGLQKFDKVKVIVEKE